MMPSARKAGQGLANAIFKRKSLASKEDRAFLLLLDVLVL
jgi:hypothetical protein